MFYTYLKQYFSSFYVFVFITIFLSFPTTLFIRYYGHDTVLSVLPGHSWANQVFLSAAYPTWFTPPRYSFPSVTLQFSPLFFSPFSVLISALNLTYNAALLPYNFVFWRVFAFAGVYALSHNLGYISTRATVMAAVYVSSGSVASNDMEYVFYAGAAIVPWVVNGLQLLLNSRHIRGALTLILSSTLFLYCGATNMWMTLPVFCLPFIWFYLCNNFTLSNFFIRFFTLAFICTTVLILASPLIVGSLAVPPFGDNYRFPISSKEGLHPYNSLFSLFFVNPFYLNHLGVAYSSSYYTSLASLIGLSYYYRHIISHKFNFLSISCVSTLLNKSHIYVFPLLLFGGWFSLLLRLNQLFFYILLFTIIFSLYFTIFFTAIYSDAPQNSNNSSDQFQIHRRDVSAMLMVGILGLICTINNPINDLMQTVFFNLRLVRWQAINSVWFILIASTVGVNTSYELFLSENLWRNFLIRLRFIFKPIFCLASLCLMWFFHETIFQFYPDTIFQIGASHLVIFIFSCVGLIATILFFKFYRKSLNYYLLYCVFTLVALFTILGTLLIGAFVDLHSMISVPRLVFALFDVIHIIIIYLMYKHSHFLIVSRETILTILILTDCALGSTRLASHLEANSVQRIINNSFVNIAPLSRTKNTSANNEIFTFPDLNPSMWFLTGTMPGNRALDAAAGDPSIFQNLVTVIPDDFPEGNLDLELELSHLRSVSGQLYCSDGTSIIYHINKHIGNTSDLSVKSTCPVIAIWLDSWSPGWTGQTDGQVVAFVRINKALRGVRLEKIDGVVSTRFSILSAQMYRLAFRNILSYIS